MQRVFDIILSVLSLLVLLPLLLPIAILLRLTGEGEVFFMQSRVGKNGQAFQLYKFATMLKASPNMGTGTVTVKNDPRILPMGYFLRKKCPMGKMRGSFMTVTVPVPMLGLALSIVANL